MDPITAAMLGAAAPSVVSMFMPQNNAPSGPDYSAAMAYMNSPEMLAYRNSMLRSAYDPQSDIYQQASNQALAQSNRIAASRGLGTSGAGIGFAQNAQNDLAKKFQEGEFQRRLQAYQAAISGGTSQGNMMMNMADKNYAAQMGNYNREMEGQAGLIGGIGALTNAGISAYNYQQNQNRSNDYMSGFAARSPGYGGGQPAGMVYNAPISGGNYNYGGY
jgi:homoserine kinase